jgi:hypothetical protein
MRYEEIKAAQLLHTDRQQLLDFLHQVITYGRETQQGGLVRRANQTLQSLSMKTMFMPGPAEKNYRKFQCIEIID